MVFEKTKPCANCPYRKDAPLAHWDRQHFTDLLLNEEQYMGKVYGCHKNDNHVCRGYLLNQWRQDLPNISLRMMLRKYDVSREYLDKLDSFALPVYESVEAMCEANFPGITETNMQIITDEMRGEIAHIAKEFADGFKPDLLSINGTGWLIADPLSGYLNALGFTHTVSELPADENHCQVLIFNFPDGSWFIPAGGDLAGADPVFTNFMWAMPDDH